MAENATQQQPSLQNSMTMDAAFLRSPPSTVSSSNPATTHFLSNTSKTLPRIDKEIDPKKQEQLEHQATYDDDTDLGCLACLGCTPGWIGFLSCNLC